MLIPVTLAINSCIPHFAMSFRSKIRLISLTKVTCYTSELLDFNRVFLKFIVSMVAAFVLS